MSQTLTYNRSHPRRRARPNRRTLRWRMATTPAIAALIVMLGTVGLDLVVDQPFDDYRVEPLAPAPPAAAAPTPEVPPTPAPAPEPADEQLVAATTAAVEAWGRFATTGDLAQVRDTFVPDGPQHRQLEQEAPSRQASQGGQPYRFTLSNPEVLADQPDGDRVVRGDIEVARDGIPPQHYRWDFRLRQDPGGQWQVWTVIEASEP